MDGWQEGFMHMEGMNELMNKLTDLNNIYKMYTILGTVPTFVSVDTFCAIHAMHSLHGTSSLWFKSMQSAMLPSVQLKLAKSS